MVSHYGDGVPNSHECVFLDLIDITEVVGSQSSGNTVADKQIVSGLTLTTQPMSIMPSAVVSGES